MKMIAIVIVTGVAEILAVVEEDGERGDGRDGEGSTQPNRVGHPVHEVIYGADKVTKGHPCPQVGPALLRECRAELGEKKRLGNEEDDRKDDHPGECFAAVRGDGGNRVDPDDGANQKEQNVELPEVAAQLAGLDRGG